MCLVSGGFYISVNRIKITSWELQKRVEMNLSQRKFSLFVYKSPWRGKWKPKTANKHANFHKTLMIAQKAHGRKYNFTARRPHRIVHGFGKEEKGNESFWGWLFEGKLNWITGEGSIEGNQRKSIVGLIVMRLIEMTLIDKRVEWRSSLIC